MLWLKIAGHTFDHTFGVGMVLDCRGEITELRPPAEADDLHVNAAFDRCTISAGVPHATLGQGVGL